MIPVSLPSLVLAASALLVDPGRIVGRIRLLLVSGSPSRAARGRAKRSVVPELTGLAAGLAVVAVPGLPVPWWRIVLAAGVAATCCAAARRVAVRRAARAPVRYPLRLAASWDLLAACLCAGMPVPSAVRAVAEDVPGAGSGALSKTADLIALGGDPVDAWEPALYCADTAALARVARRTTRSGAAMATAVAALADEVRNTAADAAEARAQRVGVLVSAPLGLCFLPAFLCLGVIPVVIGLAGRLLSSW